MANKSMTKAPRRTSSRPVKDLVAAEQLALIEPPQIVPMRMHTCFALYPFWLPSRNGYQDITIRFADRNGKITTYWAVTFDSRYGPPRELAYDIDSLIIARRFDELGRPLPSLVPLGSMRAICKELGLQINGKNFKNIRLALAQNQWAQISADIQYTATNGMASRFNANFNRYSVIHTGQQLPSGGSADCVYILLNELYLTMLNNARTRPLDYDYLRQLTHTSRRFYEIISFQIYAAIKHGMPEASIPYSRLCLFSAQTRSFDSAYVSAQMGRIHKRHLDSGYLGAVRAEMVRTANGDVDWIFYYKPGPRALREYKTFNRTGKKDIPMRDETQPAELGAGLLFNGDAQPDVPSPHSLVELFHVAARGIHNHTPLQREVRQAQELLDKHGPAKSNFIIEFAARRARQTKFKVQQFGSIFIFIAEAELAYEGHRLAIARTIESHKEQPQIAEQFNRSQEAYESYKARAAEAVQGLNERDRAALEAQAIKLIDERAPSMRRNLDRDLYRKNVESIMCTIVARRLMDEEGFQY